MLTRLRLASLLPLAALLACTVPTTSTTTANPSPPLSGNWENWQIQVGTAITSPPTGLYFVGAIQNQGTQSSAVFTTSGFGGPSTGPGTQVLDFSGTYNPSTGIVNLYPTAGGPFAYAIGFNEPLVPDTVIPAGVTSGCVYPLNYQGVECLALISLSPAVGVQIAPLDGTYAGILKDADDPSLSGNISLKLVQSNPQTNGAFGLAGTVTFPNSTPFSSFGALPLNGFIQGESVNLSYCAPGSPVIGPCIGLAGAATPDATQITVTTLSYSGSRGIAHYSGTLTRQ